MLKRIAQISSLTLIMGLAAGLAASASEEDAAAPAGSFTSHMTLPAPQFTARQDGPSCFSPRHAHKQSRTMERSPRSAIQ
jgi:hypothetical protein